MNGKKAIDRLISRYGQTVSSHLPDGWSSLPYRAFIEPLRYKNKMYLEGVNTQIGFSDQGYYLYIGPAEHDIGKLSQNAFIQSGDKKYVISRVETVFLGEKPLYIWAVLRTRIEEE